MIEIRDIVGRVSVLRRGEYSLEVDVVTELGVGRYAAPLDDDGLRVIAAERAVSEVDEIIGPELIGFNVTDQELIDSYLWEIDGTEDLSHIGANTALAVSVAVAKAGASSKGISLYTYLGGTFTTELPIPLIRVVESETADYYVIVKDIMEVTDSTDAAFKVMNYLEQPNLKELQRVIDKVSSETGLDVALGILMKKEKDIEEIVSLVENFDVAYLRPIGNEELFIDLMSELHGVFVDGEYLFKERGILDRRYYNALSIKPINFGTLTDVYNVVSDVKSERISPIISEARYESSDGTLAHLAVGFKCPAIRLDISSVEKINELIRIAEELGERGRVITFEE